MTDPTGVGHQELARRQELVERLEAIQQRIVRAGGSLERTAVLGVTKTRPASVAATAAAIGLIDLGENYSQELVAKASQPGAESVRWHMIGPVQRNKVRKLAGLVHLWQTVDRRDLASEIAKRDPSALVLVQVNSTDEPQKSGCAPTEAAGLVSHCADLGLGVRGLMTIGPTDGSDPRPAFSLLRSIAERLQLAELSMGMSDDLEAAVKEGSTMIRVGTALFGKRQL